MLNFKSVSSLVSKSQNSIAVFSKTLNELYETNKQIVEVVLNKKEKITKINQDIDILEHQKDINTKIANKIEKIIND